MSADLDALLNQHFAGRVVRKDLTKQVKPGARGHRGSHGNNLVVVSGLGNQALGLAAGGDTYKLKFGHRRRKVYEFKLIKEYRSRFRLRA